MKFRTPNGAIRRFARSGGAMRVCYLGPDDSFARLVEQALSEPGYALVAPDGGSSCDLVVDNASRSAAELRAAVLALPASIGHYVLISSFRVYPCGKHLRPWREEDADPAFDLSVNVAPTVLAARATERELRLLSRNRFPYTILRPSLIEGGEGENGDLTRWFADRVLDGGVVVLPYGELPSYRHLSQNDLARAIAAVNGRSEAYGRALNVTNQAILSYWGHAAMVRDGLHAPLRFGYVPQWRWRAAGLLLPLGELASSSLIETSPQLHNFGWRAEDPFELVVARARHCAEHRRPYDRRVVELERQVLAESESESVFRPADSASAQPRHTEPQWLLRGWAGQPASLALERMPQVQSFPTPVVKVRALTLLATEERFLRGEYPQQGHRAIGHNALLEVLSPGPHAIRAGTLAIPLSELPCGEPDCPFCRGGIHALLGIGCNGYGWGVCSTPPSHLLPVSDSLGMAALLADPLGSLIAGMSERLEHDAGPIWVAGRTFEAALVAWLAQDAGRSVVHVDRRAWDHPEFPVQAVETVLAQRRSGELEAPTLAVDFTGSTDVSWPLSHALAEGGHLFVRRYAPGIAHGIYWHELPAAAPSRAALEDALAHLQRWVQFREVNRRLGPALPLDLYWDALLPAPFSMPYLEADR